LFVDLAKKYARYNEGTSQKPPIKKGPRSERGLLHGENVWMDYPELISLSVCEL